MKHIILLLLVAACVGCENDIDPGSDQTVHLAGYLGVPDNGSAAAYWKDGQLTRLTTDASVSQATSLHVAKSSVLIGGWKRSVGSSAHSVIWTNGVEEKVEGSFGGLTLVKIHNGQLYGSWFDQSLGWVYHMDGETKPFSNAHHSFGPTAVEVSGGDLYVSGGSNGNDTIQHAECWKNGKLIFRDPKPSNAMSVFVHDGDVYMGGYVFDDRQIRACYWKNGTRIDVSDETLKAAAWSIYVTGEHVYLSGSANDQAAYWKDNQLHFLTTEGTYSMAMCISVKDDDIHVGGYQNGFPAYWKNDVKQVIDTNGQPGQIKFIAVGSD